MFLFSLISKPGRTVFAEADRSERRQSYRRSHCQKTDEEIPEHKLVTSHGHEDSSNIDAAVEDQQTVSCCGKLESMPPRGQKARKVWALSRVPIQLRFDGLGR